jgi:hypothetical protein
MVVGVQGMARTKSTAKKAKAAARENRMDILKNSMTILFPHTSRMIHAYTIGKKIEKDRCAWLPRMHALLHVAEREIARGAQKVDDDAEATQDEEEVKVVESSDTEISENEDDKVN